VVSDANLARFTWHARSLPSRTRPLQVAIARHHTAKPSLRPCARAHRKPTSPCSQHTHTFESLPAHPLPTREVRCLADRASPWLFLVPSLCIFLFFVPSSLRLCVCHELCSYACVDQTSTTTDITNRHDMPRDMSWLSPKRRRTTTALPTVGDRIKNGVDEQRPLSPSPRFTSPKPVLPSPTLKQRASRTFSTASATSAAATIEEEGNLFYAYARRVRGSISCYASHAILTDPPPRPTNSTLDTCSHSLPRKSRANGGHSSNRAFTTPRVRDHNSSRSKQTTSSSRLGSTLLWRTSNRNGCTYNTTSLQEVRRRASFLSKTPRETRWVVRAADRNSVLEGNLDGM
jgi:hypothetical protein